MAKIEREDIQIISRHSNWSEKDIQKVLKNNIYNDKASWLKFIKTLFFSLGIGFTTAGIVFFFAYNWAALHKFLKIGLLEFLIVASILIVVFAKISVNIKNILLTGTSMLVGVLFAVFGQIYQTGANAYDFFLGWTLAITVWVMIANFAPLWLLFICLVNTTILLYAKQVAQDWSDVFVLLLLFVINVVFLGLSLFLKKNIKEVQPPNWFTNIIALTAVTYSTIAVCFEIFKTQQTISLYITVTLVYVIGVIYALKEKNLFYVSIISLSMIIIISCYLLEISYHEAMLLTVCLFDIISTTLVIKMLINLQKKWIN